MPQSKAEKRKAFLLSFIITLGVMLLLIIAAIYFLQHSFLVPNKNKPEIYIPREEDNLTVLICGRNDEGKGEVFALVGFYPREGTMPVTVLPPQTLIEMGEGIGTLSQAYALGGTGQILDSIGKTMGIYADRFIDLNKSTFIDIITKLGPFDYRLEENLQAGGISFSKGLQQLDGTRAAAIILHRGENEPPEKPANRAADVISAIINGKLKDKGTNQSLFKELKAMVETDISLTDFMQRKNAIGFVGKLAKTPAYRIILSGTPTEDKASFALSKEAVQKLGEEYY